MNREIAERREKWIKALRSGEYKQGFTRLRQDDRYCCLGVACDVYHQMTGEGQWIDSSFKGFVFRIRPEDTGGAQIFLPRTVANFFGVKTPTGEFMERDAMNALKPTKTYVRSLSGMNDSGEFTLEEVADFLENNPEAV